jgi:hypothetical protein
MSVAVRHHEAQMVRQDRGAVVCARPETTVNIRKPGTTPGEDPRK